MAAISTAPPRLPSRAQVALLKLRLTMLGTFAAVVAIATLLIEAVLLTLGLPALSVYLILPLVVVINLLQWLFGPYIINAVYRVRPLAQDEEPWLHEAVQRYSRACGLSRTPKLMLAQIDIPNAFAYGSPLSGPMVAVTSGILRGMPAEELEAVIGHELGHLKHRDVAFMLMVSLIPAVIYYLGYMLYMSAWFRAGYGRQGSPLLVAAVGMGLMVISFFFNLFVFFLSRLRETYADANAAMVVPDGARKLQRALARILLLSGRIKKDQALQHSQLKLFFISDPAQGVRGYEDVDELVERLKASKESLLVELFSTHPSPGRRLRYLDAFIPPA
ncbi:MAG: zinc metalloprotease HtpX [Nitrososphaerota archaeon]